MRPNISEFSYGYALTENMIKDLGGGLKAAPVFPSLIDEGRAGGYDVQIPFPSIPLFLQFKLSDHMVRANATECQRGLLNPPFYRMYLRPGRFSKQHELLVDLERLGNEVYYAAPAFHEPIDLNKAYATQTVVQNSVFFRPSDLIVSDDEEHHVAFTYNSRYPTKAWLFQKRKKSR
jgi:hypothetical protein